MTAALGGVGLATVAAIAAALFLGALVQGVVGLGLGLVSAPVITLAEPDLMPGLLLMLALVLPVVTLAREREEVDWRGLGWSTPTRVVGTAGGVWLVATVDGRTLGGVVGLMVLLAVAVTVHAVEVPVNRGTLAGAGLVSGVTGTAATIGGPPMALLYQHRPPSQVRPTLAVFFLLGAALSLGGLLLAGELSRQQGVLALVMVPALVAGVAVAARVRGRVDRERFRTGVLVVCSLAAVVLLVRAVS